MTIERGLTVFFLVVSAGYLYSATGFALGSLASPKAGFAPQIIGVLAVALCLIDLVGTLRRKTGKQEKSRFLVAAAFAAGMVLYVVALPLVGFVISTLAGTFLLLKISGTKGYFVPTAISAGLTGVVWFGFGTLLNVQLP